MRRFSNIAHSVMAAAKLASTSKPAVPVLSVMQYLGQWHLRAIGGLSAITYHPQHDVYHLLADDRSAVADVCHHLVRLAMSDNGIGRAEFVGTRQVFDEAAGTRFHGVRDIAPLSETSFLAVERAATVSIYRAYVGPDSAILTKTPLIDLDAIPALRPLDNIAGITLGPTLPDGRTSVVLASQSHRPPHEITRFVAFALYHVPRRT
jgi:hypothetical protein